MRLTALVMALLSLLAPRAAKADECDDAGTLTGIYLQRCKSTLHSNCKYSHGSSKDRCIKSAVDSALRSQERAEKRKQQESATDSEWGMCTSDAYQSACSELATYRNDICGVAHQRPDFGTYGGSDLEKTATMWLERYRAYEAGKAKVEAFTAKYGKCERAPSGYRPHCEFFEHERKECAAAEAKFKENWAAYIDDFETNVIGRMDQEIAKIKAAKKAPTSLNNYYIDLPVREIAEIRRVNDGAPWIQVSPARIDAIAKKVAAKDAEMTAALEVLLSKVHCPVHGKKGKLLAVMEEHARKTKNPSSTLVETVKAFATQGQPRMSREPFKHLTHQDQGAKTCVLQEQNGRQTCRIFSVTFRRTKPDGGSWGPWAFYSTGGGDLMSCKNLK